MRIFELVKRILNPIPYVVRFRDGYHAFIPQTKSNGVVGDPAMAYKFTKRQLASFPIGTPVRLDKAPVLW